MKKFLLSSITILLLSPGFIFSSSQLNAADNTTAPQAETVVNPEVVTPSGQDADNDGVDDSFDTCPDTSMDVTVNSYGCSDDQLLTADSDGDGITDAEENTGYTGTLSPTIPIRTNPTRADTDGDGLNDAVEKNGNTNPTRADTDGDGLNDGKDAEPNTPADKIGYIDATGKYDPALFESRDNDGDGIKDAQESPGCLNTDEGATVMKSEPYNGCSTAQRNTLLRLKSSKTKITDLEQKILSIPNASDTEIPDKESALADTYGQYLTMIEDYNGQAQTIGIDTIVQKTFPGIAIPQDVAKGADANTEDYIGRDNDVNGEARNGLVRSARLEKLSNFAEKFNNFLFMQGGNSSLEVGEKGARNFLVTVARDAKNFFTILAFVFLVIVILMFFFGSKGEDDAKKVRNAVIYTSLGIMLMQTAYVFINTLYNKDVGAGGGATAIDFYKAIVLPIINLVRMLASFAFLAMAFVAFFQMVTSGGDAKAREKGIKTIVGSIIGFVLIKLSEVLVTSVYGKINCPSVNFAGACNESLLTDPNISDTLKIFTTIVNYVNGFIGLATLLIIIYAGWNIMFNGEEGMKKGKGMIKWIVVGMLLLVTSYILFRFIILRN